MLSHSSDGRHCVRHLRLNLLKSLDAYCKQVRLWFSGAFLKGFFYNSLTVQNAVEDMTDFIIVH